MFKSINGGQLPQRATKYSAGFDVFANGDVVIGAGETKLVGLGIALDIEYFKNGDLYPRGKFRPKSLTNIMEQHYFALHIRSSLRAKGLTSLGTGVVDIDYRDEIKMVIHNPINLYQPKFYNQNNYERYALQKQVAIDNDYTIKKGDKIGQLILCRHEGWLLSSEYTKDDERNGGFGSTGA